MEKTDCKICKKVVKDDQKGLSCDLCMFWSHKKCSKVSDKDYDFLTKANNSSIKWFCDICCQKDLGSDNTTETLQSLSHQLTDLNKKINSFEYLNDFLKDIDLKLSKFEKKLSETESRVINLERIKTTLSQVNLRIEKLEAQEKPQSSGSQDNDIIVQMKDWHDRQNNLIIYNLPESKFANNDDILKDDIKHFIDVVSQTCNISFNNNDIVKSARLGKKREEENKVRPLLIKLKSLQIKNDILKKAFNFKNTGFAVSIDKTPEERQKYKKVLAEKEVLEKADNSGKFIYQIRGPPWNPQIMKKPNNRN